MMLTLTQKGDSKKIKGVETLADHDIELPKGIEVKLPIPKDSKVKIAVEAEDALADYERDSSNGTITQGYKEMDNTSLTDEHLPKLDLHSETNLDDEK